jgi:hypothetical protein
MAVYSLTSLTYVSSATEAFTSRGLATLLARARENNARIGITGMLLYKEGNFMQVLEGPPAVVRRQFLAIRLDYRHRGLTTLLEESVESRRFSEWSMAFWNLSTANAITVPGYSDFINTTLTAGEFESEPSRAEKLLLTFRNSLSLSGTADYALNAL